ncbi:unnamed protein product, partial [Prorocentrum cordatum]
MVKEVLAKEVGALKQQRDPPGAGPPQPPPAESGDDPLLDQIEALESTVAGLKRAKLSGQLLVDAEAQLASLRAQRLEAKTPQNHVIVLNGKLTRLRGKLERLEKAKSAKQQAVDDARAALDQCLADQVAHEKDTQNTRGAIETAEREVQAAVLKVARGAGPAHGGAGAGLSQAFCSQLDAAEQRRLVEELLAPDPLGQQVGAGAGKILVTLLGRAMAKAAPPAAAHVPPAGGDGAASAEDEPMPEAFDQTTADSIITAAAQQPDAKRALAAAMRGLNMAVIKETMRSGGVGIIAKRHLDLWWGPLECSAVDGRISVAFARLPPLGALALYSVHLETGVGLSGNLAALRTLEHRAKGHHLPWIAGGDWNLDPEATCHGGQGTHHVRDFFVSGGRVGFACRGPRVHPEHLVPTHDFVELAIQGAGDWPTARVAKQPPPLPASRPVGPRVQPPDWEGANAAVREALAEASRGGLSVRARQEPVNQAHASWPRTARQDFGGIVDASAAQLSHWGGQLAFEEQPLCKVLATPKNPRSRASSGMRWLAGQLGQAAELLGDVLCGGRAQLGPLREALRRLGGALEPGGRFHHHCHRQPDWPEWEALLRHFCMVVRGEMSGWLSSTPGPPGALGPPLWPPVGFPAWAISPMQPPLEPPPRPPGGRPARAISSTQPPPRPPAALGPPDGIPARAISSMQPPLGPPPRPPGALGPPLWPPVGLPAQ